MAKKRPGENQATQYFTLIIFAALAISAIVFITIYFTNDNKLPFVKNYTEDNRVMIYVHDDQLEPQAGVKLAINYTHQNQEQDEQIVKITDSKGKAYINKSELQIQNDTTIEILVDKDEDNVADIVEILVYRNKQFVTIKSLVNSTIKSFENNITINIGSRKYAYSNNEKDNETKITLKQDKSTKKTYVSSVSKNNTRSQKDITNTTNNSPKTQKTESEESQFPITKTSNTTDVYLSCSNTDVKTSIHQFTSQVIIHENGDVVANITANGNTKNFDLDSFDITNKVHINAVSFSGANSTAEDILNQVVVGYKKAVVKKNLKENNYACYYGKSKVYISVEHTCNDGSEVSFDPVNVLVTKSTIVELGYPIEAITVIAHKKDAKAAQQTARNLARSIAEKIASNMHKESLEKARSICYVRTENRQDDLLEEDELTEDNLSSLDDLLEEDKEPITQQTGSEISSSKTSNSFTIILKNQDDEEVGTRNINFSAKVIINTEDSSIAIYIDEKMTPNLLYKIPSTVTEQNKKTQAYANELLLALIAKEVELRATILQTITGSQSYSIDTK